MAYVDREDGYRLNPAGLAGSLLLSGGCVALILFAAPNVMTKIKDIPITIWNIELPKTVEAPDTPPPAPIDRLEPPPIKTAPKSKAVSENLITPPDHKIEVTPIGPLIKDPIPDPIIIHDPEPAYVPVKVAAALDKKYAAALQPPYPPDMIRLEKEGRATVKVLIGTDGRVKSVTRVRGDDDAFLRATEQQALGKWRFKPATLDGKPVESWREMTVVFKLEGR